MNDATQPETTPDADEGESGLAGYLATGATDIASLDDGAPGVGARLTEARTALDMSPEVLADSVGVTTSTVADWEQGDQSLSPHHLNRVAGVLGVGLSWLLMGRGAEPIGEAGDLGRLRTDLTAARSRLDDVVNELAVLDQRLARLDR